MVDRWSEMKMRPDLPDSFHVLPEVAQALAKNMPLVALESTVITHGLPYPQNFTIAIEMETVIRQTGAIPATIAVLDGIVRIGVERSQLERLARGDQQAPMHKISARDFASAIACSWSGGTTVAGTLLAARLAGLRVFATGGIGGVHRQPAFDVSADLGLLACSPLVVVCAGAKAILDLDATLEYLETNSIPVVGFQTDEFPAFYSRSSGMKTSARADTPEQIAEIARAHWGMGMLSAVLVALPPPESSALPPELVELAIQQALAEAQAQQLRGQAVTPFLLQRVSQLTRGGSLLVNLDLLKNNARLAAEISLRARNQEGGLRYCSRAGGGCHSRRAGECHGWSGGAGQGRVRCRFSSWGRRLVRATCWSRGRAGDRCGSWPWSARGCVGAGGRRSGGRGRAGLCGGRFSLYRKLS